MESWRFLQLVDAAFPSGGFAHSSGLEAAVQARDILDGHAVAPLPDDVVREIDAVIGRYARSVGARRDRIPWQR